MGVDLMFRGQSLRYGPRSAIGNLSACWIQHTTVQMSVAVVVQRREIAVG